MYIIKGGADVLKRFELRNYKNFEERIVIDFENVGGYQFNTECIENSIITKMLIYGRNATGKTNLGRALMDIRTILANVIILNEGSFLNADSAEDSAEFLYLFQFEEDEIEYQYAKYSKNRLKSERLSLNKNIIFECDFADNKYNFGNLNLVDAETVNVERYLQVLETEEGSEDISENRVPFLRWLISNAALKSNSPLIKLSEYVRRMMLIAVGSSLSGRKNMDEKFFEDLEKEEALGDFEEFLNVMGIECKLVLKKLPDGQRELYFLHDKLVPFYSTASSGTLALVNMYRRFVMNAKTATLMYLDEFDAFYHYEMAENVVRFFKKKYKDCQIILTSHNTNLMTNRLMRPDCLFILSRNGKLTALCDATERELREGHNLEKMYIGGEFEKYE